MIATFIDNNGKSYDLPKKVLKISNLIDDAYASSAESSSDSYRKQYKFVCEVLSKDIVDEMLEGTNINDIALDNLTIMFKDIEQAYLKSVNDHDSERQSELFNNPAIDKIIKMGNSFENINKVTNNQKK